MSINKIFLNDSLTKIVNNKTTQKIVSDLGNESKLLPILVLEAGLLTGRSYQANKRGGYYELKETVLENLLAAAVWMGGIKILNKAANTLFKKVLNIDTSVDWKEIPNLAKGRVNPEQFLNKIYLAKFSKLLFSVGLSIFTVGALLPKFKQKLTKDSIEKKKREHKLKKPSQQDIIYTSKDNKVVIRKNITTKDLNKPANSPLAGSRFLGQKALKHNNPSFGGTIDILSKVGHALENETIPQLAVVDSGITSGRVINSRNKDEAIEILFRDASSCVFYYFCIPYLTKKLANMYDAKLGINTRLDPKALNPLNKAFQEHIFNTAKANKGLIGISDIQKALNGVNNELVTNALKDAIKANNGTLTAQQVENVIKNLDEVLTKAVTETLTMPSKDLLKTALPNSEALKEVVLRAKTVAKIQTDIATSNNVRALSNLMDDVIKSANEPGILKSAKGIQKLSDGIYKKVQNGKGLTDNNIQAFKKLVERLNNPNLEKTLQDKVNQSLETILKGASQEGKITEKSLEEIAKGGITRDSSFISKLFALINPNVVNPKKYISEAEKAHLQENISTYAKRLTEEFKKAGITEEKMTLEKAEKIIKETITQTKNKNLFYKGIYLLIGFAIATAFLSYIIPKAQCLITKIRTGQDGFPGVAGMLEEDNEITHSNTPSIPYNSGSAAFDAFLNQYKRTNNNV